LKIADYQDPAGCPAAPPALIAMGPSTRALHEAVDAQTRRTGTAFLHPIDPTLQRDMLGSAQVVAWQEGKAEHHFMGEGCWSELPPLYGRYGTPATLKLIAEVRRLENAGAALVTDCGMQAVALVFDTLLVPGAHAVCMRQVYNKTRSFLERLAGRVGGTVTIVDDGDLEGLRAAIRPETTLVFAETFTNPLLRAQDPDALVGIAREGRRTAPRLRLVVDSTIASPWSLRRPLLDAGVDVVVASGTKSLSGQDRDMWGLVATNDIELANQAMDLVALRGGILDWRRAEVVLAGLPEARERFARRCENALRIAKFLTRHPLVERVNHPSVATHPDAAVIARHYVRHGSLLSFRVRGASEEQARHIADALCMTVVVRFALSFDGLVTKVNHHRSVSEYFTPAEVVERNGIDRLIRIGVGTEDPEDLVAALNWALHHGLGVSTEAIAEWQRNRMGELGLD
jgi:methionine-gamma-lyase